MSPDTAYDPRYLEGIAFFNESEFFAHQLQIATLIRLDTLSDRLLTIAFALERLNEIQGSRQ